MGTSLDLELDEWTCSLKNFTKKHNTTCQNNWKGAQGLIAANLLILTYFCSSLTL